MDERSGEADFTLNDRMPVGKRSTLALQGTYQKDALKIVIAPGCDHIVNRR